MVERLGGCAEKKVLKMTHVFIQCWAGFWAIMFFKNVEIREDSPLQKFVPRRF